MKRLYRAMRRLEILPKEEASLTQAQESERCLHIQRASHKFSSHAPRVGEKRLEQRTRAREARAKPRYVQISIGREASWMTPSLVTTAFLITPSS